MLGYASRITRTDLIRYIELINSGKEDAAISFIMSKYIRPVADKFIRLAVTGISRTDGIVLSSREMAKISLNIKFSSDGLKESLDYVFTDIIRKAISPITFSRLGITSNQAKTIITRHSIESFKERTAGAMANTQSDVLRAIRNYQKDLAIRMYSLDRKASLGSLTKSEIDKFKSRIIEDVKKLNPDYVRLLKEGKLIASRTSIDGRVMHYGIDQYAEMSIRNAILNFDRMAAETAARANGDAVVQIYLRDHRRVKTEREICKHVLANGGLLAMSKNISSVLGIPTLDEYRELDGMGMGCRHSIRQIDGKTSESINKVLFLKGLTDDDGTIIEKPDSTSKQRKKTR